MRSPKYVGVILLTIAFLLVMAGCTTSKPLLDESGKVVSLENKDKPTLVIFFTGNT